METNPTLQTPTVFIIGAGASIPYGFPSGPQLVRRLIQEQLVHDGGPEPFTRGIVEVDTKAREALRLSGLGSIDQFLEKRPEFSSWGRIRLTRILLESENAYKSKFVNWHQELTSDWLEYLWSTYLATKPERLKDHSIKFVTYNYDRLIEHSLAQFASHSFGISLEAARSYTKDVTVEHLHGHLGEIGPLDDKATSGPEFTLFGDTSAWRTYELQHVVAGCQLVCDIGETDPRIMTAARWIAESRRIVVIGIGQAVTPLSQLVRAAAHEIQKTNSTGSLYSPIEVDICTHGLWHGQKNRIAQLFSALTTSLVRDRVRTHDLKALETLKEIPHLT